MNTIKRLLGKLVLLVIVAALLVVGTFGTYNGVKAASGTVDLVAVGTGHHQMYWIGQPGNGSCTSVRIPLVDTLSDTATFTLRPHTKVTLIQNNWGDYWKVQDGAVISNDMTVTGLEADFTATGTITVDSPHGMSRDMKVCYEHVGTSATDTTWRAYGLGVAPAANVVKLPFKDHVVYNHTVDLNADEHNFPGGFVAYNVPTDATSITFTTYDQTEVSAVVFGKDITVPMTMDCTANVCTATFPEGTTRADWSAPQVFYDWDGTGTEPATTGINVTATNAMTP